VCCVVKLRFEVLTAIVVFWVVTPRSLVGGYERFGETYRFLFLKVVNALPLSVRTVLIFN
jgi:hypothetical protein